MGTWESGLYDNDEAQDFIGELMEGGDLAPLRGALEAVAAAGENYLEAPDAERALVAADLVAWMAGRPSPEPPEELGEFVAETGSPPDETLLAQARAAVDRVLTQPSELFDLWKESGNFAAWRAQLEALRARL